MAIKKFKTAPREGAKIDEKLTPKPFTLPGEEHVYTAKPPKEVLWQRVQLAGRPNAPVSRRIQAMLDFVHGTLASAEDAARLEERLLSGADALDLVDVFPVVGYLSEAWTAEAEGRLEQFEAEHAAADAEDDEPAAEQPEAGDVAEPDAA